MAASIKASSSSTPSVMKLLASATNSDRASANSNKSSRYCNLGQGWAQLPRQRRSAEHSPIKLLPLRPSMPLLRHLSPVRRPPTTLARSRSSSPIRTSLHPAGCPPILAMKTYRSVEIHLIVRPKTNANEGTQSASRGAAPKGGSCGSRSSAQSSI